MAKESRLIPGSQVADILSAASVKLRAAGIEPARLDARLIIAAATGWSREALLLSPDRVPDDEAFGKIETMIERRANREPLSHILGRREFWSLPFKVTPDVLTPRPDSETVIEAVLAWADGRKPPLRLLDLGTGSGCLLLALLHEFPAATGTGVDRSAAALDVAGENAHALGMSGRIRLRHDNWGNGLADTFDVIVANPPYIPAGDIVGLAREVAGFEPRSALDGGADGLEAYRMLLPDVRRLLAADGLAALEVGAGQADAVTALAAGKGLKPIGRRRDLAGIDRVVLLQG